MPGLADLPDKKAKEKTQKWKSQGRAGVIVGGTTIKIVGKPRRLKKVFKPICLPEGKCYHDGKECVDRMEYIGCDSCSCDKDLDRIKEKRNIMIAGRQSGKTAMVLKATTGIDLHELREQDAEEESEE